MEEREQMMEAREAEATAVPEPLELRGKVRIDQAARHKHTHTRTYIEDIVLDRLRTCRADSTIRHAGSTQSSAFLGSGVAVDSVVCVCVCVCVSVSVVA